MELDPVEISPLLTDLMLGLMLSKEGVRVTLKGENSPLSIFYSAQSQAPAALLDHFKPHLKPQTPQAEVSFAASLAVILRPRSSPTMRFYKQLQLASRTHLPTARPLLY